MKFHEDRCKEEAVMRMKSFYLTMHLQTDRQTDRVIPVYPPNFVAGGIISNFYRMFKTIFKPSSPQTI